MHYLIVIRVDTSLFLTTWLFVLTILLFALNKKTSCNYNIGRKSKFLNLLVCELRIFFTEVNVSLVPWANRLRDSHKNPLRVHLEDHIQGTQATGEGERLLGTL